MNLESGSQLGAIPAFWGRGDEGTGLRVSCGVGGRSGSGVNEQALMVIG